MAGLDGYGTSLSRGDGAGSETFTALANVTKIRPPGMRRAVYDVTAHDSSDGWREFIAGLKDGGEVMADVNYDPSSHDSLVADFADTDPRNYQLAFPDTSQWTFTAFLTGFEPDAPHDNKLTAKLRFKITGKPTVS